jgi:hypothetical protein
MCRVDEPSVVGRMRSKAAPVSYKPLDRLFATQRGQDQHRLVSFVHPSSRAASSSSDARCSPLSRRWGALTPVVLREAAKKSSIHDRKIEEQQQQQQQG